MKLLLTAALLALSATASAQTPPRAAPKPMAGAATASTNPTPARDNVADATRTAVLDDKDQMDPAFQAIEADRKDKAARRAAARANQQANEPEEEDDGR